ncbi:DUF5986 family protein [Pseudobacillus sp. 179-B 2D1 NHS]|uniref:DUF5986 family protein n=1 Tax=Pseudobacillus sp. 179-B 2D1 NHS TaxID=3374292 RepID=UPI003879B02B
MLNNGSAYSEDYLKNVFMGSITKAYEVDYVKFKNSFERKSTNMADNPFIKDCIHDRITDQLRDNDRFIVYPNKRGSGGHIIVFDLVTQKLYSVIHMDRYKVVSKEATDPDKPAHYLFIYAQVNPIENNEQTDWGLIPLEAEHLNESLVLKREHAKEEAKKYLRNLNPESFVLVVYEMDKSTNTISTVQAFSPSSLHLTPLNEIENWSEHKPVFSFEEQPSNEKEIEEEQIIGIDLKPEIKKQLEDKDKPSIEKKKEKKNSEETD